MKMATADAGAGVAAWCWCWCGFLLVLAVLGVPGVGGWRSAGCASRGEWRQQGWE